MPEAFADASLPYATGGREGPAGIGGTGCCCIITVPPTSGSLTGGHAGLPPGAGVAMRRARGIASVAAESSLVGSVSSNVCPVPRKPIAADGSCERDGVTGPEGHGVDVALCACAEVCPLGASSRHAASASTAVWKRWFGSRASALCDERLEPRIDRPLERVRELARRLLRLELDHHAGRSSRRTGAVRVSDW